MNTPDSGRMHELLGTECFRERVEEYMKFTIQADVWGLDSKMVQTMAREPELAYSRLPNFQGSDGRAVYEDRLCRVIRTQQMHTCTQATCLRYDRYGHLKCKHRAPWELSNSTSVSANGDYKIRRTLPFLNNFNPAISVALNCNNDIKFLTNGSDTKDAMWYSTMYQSKKQGRNYNISALLAKAFLYHNAHRAQHGETNIIEQNRLLLFCCHNATHHEKEFSAQQVMAYLMNWGDCICSHRYSALYWTPLKACLLRVFPQLQMRR